MITKNYQFLLNSNPYPIITTANIISTILSTTIFIKNLNNMNMIIIRTIILIINILTWIINYSKELTKEGKTRQRLEKGIKIAILTFISTELIFFVSFFWSFLNFFLSPRIELGITWPPHIIENFDWKKIPIINTLILISSRVTVTIAHFYLNENKFKKININIKITIALGTIFTILQGIEYTRRKFRINDNTFGSTFFILTGFHGIHVIAGSIFLFLVTKKIIKIEISKINSLKIEISAWYWHFVDIIWLNLFLLIYYIRN